MAEPTAASDLPQKLARVRSILDQSGLERVWLTDPGTLSWLFDGARCTVALNGPPVLAAAISAEDVVVRCPVNELDRLVVEELPPGPLFEAVPWFGPLLPAKLGTGEVQEAALANELRSARASLLGLELVRYRAWCATVAALVTHHAASITRTTTERSVAAAIGADIMAEGGDPLVVMVAGVDRQTLRHPLPTDGVVGAGALLVVCARRHGMTANLSRWIALDPRSTEQRARTRRLLDVEADLLRATRVGRCWRTIFGELTDAYPRHGFRADEIDGHHQGGPTGYLGRDPKVDAMTEGSVADCQALAWNPSTEGDKVEDTMLVTCEGLEVLTVDPDWPTVSVDGRPRPCVLGET